MKDQRPPVAAAQDSTLAEVPVAEIVVGEQQLRIDPYDDGLAELALDIQAKGLLQPIGLVPSEPGPYQLLFGSRRLAAHVRLGRTTILARIFATAPGELRAVALVENLQRVDLSLEEETRAVAYLHDEEKRSPDQIAALLSKSRAWVLRRLAVPGLPADLRAPLLAGQIPLGAAEQIARVDDINDRAYLIAQSAHGDMTIDQIRTAIDAHVADQPMRDEIDRAVAVGLAAPEPPLVHLPCEACGHPRPIAELRIVRVCADACASTTAAAS